MHALDNDYESDESDEPESDIELDDRNTPINENEIGDIRADTARQQSITSNIKNDEHSDATNNHDPNVPLPKLWCNRARSYKHLKGRGGDGSLPTITRPHEFSSGKHQAHVILQSIVMTQYNLKQGIKKFGDVGKAAVLVELQQPYDHDVMCPVMKYDLTPAKRKGALRYLMFLKDKRCGKIKACRCADGRSQREYMSKEETSLPTVATESLILSCVVDAIEGRDVATCDIPGAFMQSDMKGKVIMKLEGVMAEVIIKIDTKLYSKYVKKENGKDVIDVILTKALYGMLQAALLFWQNLSTEMKKWGFEINPYDFCVANKTIDGQQCTVVWHVNDLKISHIDAKTVTTILNLLDGKYGQEIVGGKRAALTINQGAIHDYLGMTLDYSEAGFVKINMVDYVKKVLTEMPQDMDGSATSPAADHLFKIIKGVDTLNKTKSEFFHATVAKLLFLCKRGRPNIQTAIAFLCTRIQQPTKHDYNKLMRVIKYLCKTTDLVLRLGANNLNIIKWWVNASYGVHDDMRSHTGGTMSMGTGAVYSTSRKQKLNTKSSTKAKLVGIDDVLQQALWTKYFMEAQGYGVSTILNQDNQSTIKLSDNGKASSGKGTRHINIRYFFITNRIARKRVAIQYCPTKEMAADYLMKPLQGELFYKFRDQIMGVVPMETINGDHKSVLDHHYSDPVKAEKRIKVSPVIANDARLSHAPIKKSDGHQSWVDVVKLTASKGLNGRLQSIIKG
jgi:hypothetical protein